MLYEQGTEGVATVPALLQAQSLYERPFSTTPPPPPLPYKRRGKEVMFPKEGEKAILGISIEFIGGENGKGVS